MLNELIDISEELTYLHSMIGVLINKAEDIEMSESIYELSKKLNDTIRKFDNLIQTIEQS